MKIHCSTQLLLCISMHYVIAAAHEGNLRVSRVLSESYYYDDVTSVPTGSPSVSYYLPEPTKKPIKIATPTKEPTYKPTKATKEPTKEATKEPTIESTKEPTESPTKKPTKATVSPTKEPTKSPTKPPTEKPTKPPTEKPTKPPTEKPTKPPTEKPTKPPTEKPTKPPTEKPTKPPTEKPTKPPTNYPTKPPTEKPTKPPTEKPTKPPTEKPTKPPTEKPTKPPTNYPTKPPTEKPTKPPTEKPTKPPTNYPTKPPTEKPTKPPTDKPTKPPTKHPTKPPTKSPSKSPTREPTKPPTKASAPKPYACALPPGTTSYSLITANDAQISAHDVYKPIIIGGTLCDGSPTASGNIGSKLQGKSYIKDFCSNTIKMFNNFDKGGYSTISDISSAPIDWDHFEWLAKNAQSSTSGSYKVVVFTKCGTFDLYDLRNGGQGEDDGKTLVIFNTSCDITLTKTHDGRQFGASVIAPFAKVTLMGDAGYVDGFIVAKEFTDSGYNKDGLQMHGDGYYGPISC